MRDNKGFSMVELIVTVAIMAVVTGVVVYSMALVTGQEAKECATNLSSALDRAKNFALYKSGNSDAYLIIKRSADESLIAEYYVPQNPVDKPEDAVYLLIESEKLGKKAVELICHFSDGTQMQITETEWLAVYYDRISGAFKTMKKVTPADIGNLTNLPGTECNGFEIKRGKTYKIELILPTGKHVLSQVD